jgi:hypothetical protein
MVRSSPNVELGWFDRLKNSLQLDTIAEKLNLSKYRLLDMALFLGIGFLLGFLWKRYANYFIAMLIFVAVLIIFNQLDLVNLRINWIRLQECCGVQPAVEDADILAMLWGWAKMNVMIIFSFIIGFCFGAKVS